MRDDHWQLGSAHGTTHGTTHGAGWTGFAGSLLFLLGAFQLVAGLTAVFDRDYFLVTSSGLATFLGYRAWGVLHLLLCAVAAPAGVAVLRGRHWGRATAAGVAVASAMVNLAFMAAEPVWATLTIALDLLVVYAVTVHGHFTPVRQAAPPVRKDAPVSPRSARRWRCSGRGR
jgi:hypothetical protein